MFLLEEPFVSDLLADFVEKSGVRVYDNAFARRRLAGRKINFSLEPGPGPHYTNSENALALVTPKRFGTELPRQIAALKDKAAFRAATRALFPGLAFRKISFSELLAADAAALPYPFVLKPSVGFLSIGVYMVRTPADWEAARRALVAGQGRTAFSKAIVDESAFLMETLLEGPEIAVDAYYDGAGEPVIIDIYSHPFANAADVRDRVYVTSAAIIARYLPRVRDIFARTGKLFGLRDFPLHCEFRETAAGIVPIEFNPFRFAGWCTTDLAWHAWGFLPYEMLVSRRAPAFPAPAADSRLYYFTLAERVPGTEGKAFDYEAFGRALPGLRECRRFDPRRFPVSAIAFGAARTEEEIQGVLNLDLAPFYR